MILRLYHCCLIHFFLFVNGGMSEVFRVGDEDGWSADTNFAFWSQNYSFSKGDFLVFNYPKNGHNVYEVTEATYRSCNGSTGVLAQYDSGNDQIQLKEARKYWFICDVAGHCLDGMRFGIEVKEANSSFDTLIIATAESPAPTSYAYQAFGNAFEIWTTLVCIVAFGILLSLS